MSDLKFANEVDAVLADVRAMLLAKNEAYGDAALSPIRVFSRAETEEQIRVRMDDKLTRIARGHAAGEDPEWDLLGYGVLLMIHRRRGAR